MKRFPVMRIRGLLSKLVIGAVLCFFIGIQTRYGHHVVYTLISKAVEPYAVSFAEKDFYISFPAGIVIQRLTVDTETSSYVVHGTFLKIDLLKACKRLIASPATAPSTHWSALIPPEIASCRIQRVELPSFMAGVTLRDVCFERKRANILRMTIENKAHTATLKAKMKETIRWVLDGDVSWASVHLAHAKISGTVQSTPEASEIIVHAVADQGAYRDVTFQDVAFHGKIDIKDKTSITLKDASLSWKSALLSGTLQGEVAYVDNHLKGSVELVNALSPHFFHAHGLCCLSGTPQDVALHLTAAVNWRHQIWNLQSNARILQQKRIEFQSGRLSGKTTELALETPFCVPFSLNNIRGTCRINTSNIAEVSSWWGIPLVGAGAGTFQFIEKSGRLAVSFVVQGSQMYCNDAWSVAQCQLSGEVRGIMERYPDFFLSGKSTDITTPYGTLKTCAVALKPRDKQGNHAVELDLSVTPSDALRATGTINFRRQSVVVDRVQSGGLSLTAPLRGTLTKGVFASSGGLRIGSDSEIAWEGHGH
ncbi:MAG: hypothetical protein LBQ26_00810, partial [Holosporales bacterium]|nr:hypothetical protein [Holosporales bacterium]